MPRDLLFMSDYSADPIWDAATESMVRLDSLPISDETRASIRDWASRWKSSPGNRCASTNAESGMRAGAVEPVPAQAWERIEADGRALRERLRQELGNGWRVGWVSFEHGKRHAQWEADGAIELYLPSAGRRG